MSKQSDDVSRSLEILGTDANKCIPRSLLVFNWNLEFEGAIYLAIILTVHYRLGQFPGDCGPFSTTIDLATSVGTGVLSTFYVDAAGGDGPGNSKQASFETGVPLCLNAYRLPMRGARTTTPGNCKDLLLIAYLDNVDG